MLLIGTKSHYVRTFLMKNKLVKQKTLQAQQLQTLAACERTRILYPTLAWCQFQDTEHPLLVSTSTSYTNGTHTQTCRQRESYKLIKVVLKSKSVKF